MRHLLTLFDLSTEEILDIFACALDLKKALAAGVREPILRGRVMAMLFDKPSLRTRVSFESAMTHLGGACQYLGKDVGWGDREAVQDFSRVLSEFVDLIACRTGAHERIEQLAEHSTVPVINGLTASAHPCQALADLFTLSEIHGDFPGQKLAYIGDGNNVARSLAVACAKLGVHFTIASPAGYGLDDSFVQQLRDEIPDAQVDMLDDPLRAVVDATAVYTDVWASMGQESEKEERKRVFANFQVDGNLMRSAPDKAVFLHCLPAHRGDEVTDEVIDSAQSVVIQQAGNRMHVQKAIIAWILR